jgi:cellulase/cellobiase CelA1
VAGLAAAGLVAGGVVVGVLISGSASPNATGGNGTPPPASSTTTTPPPDERCTASFAVVQTWEGGYKAEVTVRNDGTEKITGWTVRWTVPDGHQINGVWNGVKSLDGRSITVTNEDWNAALEPGEAIEPFGMTVNSTDENPDEPVVDCTAD